MNLSRILKITVISAAALGAAVSLPWAFCSSAVESYALFHCGPRAYVAPVPPGFMTSQVTGVFWQFGFGNLAVNTGLGNDGTAFASKAFNGNDNGTFTPNVLDAAAAFPATPFPPGSVCLGSNNWSNSGVDGCCDNTRPGAPFSYFNNYSGFGPYTYDNDDDLLNPWFGTFQNTSGFPGYYSIASMMDYPTAVLLRLPNDAFFAVMAVTNQDRGNTGGNGPCNIGSPGTNQAACDVFPGVYNFAQINNGLPNAIPSEAGKNNVVPWQVVRPREVSGLDCGVVDCGGPTIPVQFQIDPVMIHSDETVIPSNNPTMDTRDNLKPADTTRAAGVGVRDLKRKWAGLVRYTLEVAPINTDPNLGTVNVDPNGDVIYTSLAFVDDPNSTNGIVPPLDGNGNPTGPILIPSIGTRDIPIPSCWRARVEIGKTPEVTGTSCLLQSNTRIGKCGDIGLPLTILPSARSGITCFGNRDPLVSENISDAALQSGKGRHTITWETTAELSVIGFDIYALTARGEKYVKTVACEQCTTGVGGLYEEVLRSGDIRGGKLEGFRIKMNGGSGDTVDLPVHP